MATLYYMLFDSLPTVFTAAVAKSCGVTDRVLYGWRDTQRVDQIARGLFIKSGVEVDYDLVEIAVRSQMGTICLTSALSRHDLSDDIPSSINIALPRPSRQPRTVANVTWHRFAVETFEIGREELGLVDEIVIGIYNPQRCIIDSFRLCNIYGKDQANHALKKWLSKGGNPSELLDMARSFPQAETPIVETLQVLL